MRKALQLEELEVRFERFNLGPLSLELEPGHVVGLVGPNGSGKTTTIRCIAGNLFPDAGSIVVWGRPARLRDGSWKQDTGYVPDAPVFYEWMTGEGFLAFMAEFYPTWDPAFALELAERFRLDLGERLRGLSKGNRVKLSLVNALAHRPRLALFDEPTSGLDPIVRTEVFEVLLELMESEDRTVLYSTHALDDLHRLADQLVFLRGGQVQLRADKDDLVDAWRRIRFRHDEPLHDLTCVVTHERVGTMHEIVSSRGDVTLRDLKQCGVRPVDLQPLTLEEIAVHIMKEG